MSSGFPLQQKVNLGFVLTVVLFVTVACCISTDYVHSDSTLGKIIGLFNPPTVTGNMTFEHDLPLYDPREQPLPALRSEFGGRRAIVYGWLSSGGVFVHKDCGGVELDFLGLPRFETTETERDSDPEKEDAFCQRLQWIGGRYYESDTAYNNYQPEQYALQRSHAWFAWPGEVPEGGVWVLWQGPGSPYNGLGRIKNAYTMEERCKVIEMLGGTFYENWDDVQEPDFGDADLRVMARPLYSFRDGT